MQLFEEFKESSQKEWEDKIIQDLKGKPFENLIWKSEIGKVNPVLFETDIEHANPNEFPYTRGTKEFNNSWDIRQQFKESNDEKLNQQLLEALKGGVNALEIFTIGTFSFDKVFKDIQLDIIKLYIHVDSTNCDEVGENLVSYCENNKYELDSIQGGLIFDPIEEVATTGALKFEESAVNFLKVFRGRMPNMNTFGVNASVYANAGANIDTQIACALTHGHEYLVQCLNAGEELNDIVNSIEFSFGIGTSYFLEIAKIRAFRTLWSTIVNEYDESLVDFKINIVAITSNFNYSLADKYNNLLRATTGAMSAVIAGVDALVVLPFDYNEDKDSENFGLRLAKNIQLLMQEEAYFGQVIDPAGGSYYIEELTDKIQKNAWSQFQQFENKGGVMSLLSQGELQSIIEQQNSLKEEELLSEEKVMIGVNKFVNEKEELVKPEVEEESKETVFKVLKSSRLSNVVESK